MIYRASHHRTNQSTYQWLIIALLLAAPSLTLSQVQYHVNSYNMSSLNAGNQNWDITTDKNGTVFVANNYGLIEIRNSETKLHPSPSGTIMRSVSWINDRLYSGSFEEFGYWQHDSTRTRLQYVSLSTDLENPRMNNDDIWRIVQHNGMVYFHSFGDIYVYDGELVQRVPSPGQLMFLHEVGNRVFTQLIRGALYELSDRRFVQVPGTDFLSEEEVKSIVQTETGTILIGTSENLYRWSTGTEDDLYTDSPGIWAVENYEEVISARINAMAVSSRHIFIGTIGNGIYIYDYHGQLIRNINTFDVLDNNTVLSLLSDEAGNVWAGLDNGLNYIRFDSLIDIWRERNASPGSVYTAIMHDSKLFVGTNQGLFWFNFDEHGRLSQKQLVSGSQGQVWFLEEIDGELYAGLNDGTYLIRNNMLEQVSSIDGAYNLKAWPQRIPQAYLQSTYNDLVEFRRQDEILRKYRIIPDLNMPARYLEFDHLGSIWLGHAVKGVYRIQPGLSEEDSVIIWRPDQIQGLNTPTGKVFRFGNRIVVPSGNSLIQWDAINDTFIPFDLLDEHFTMQTPILAIHQAGAGRYWVIKRDELLLIELRYDTVELIYRILPVEFDLNLVEGYENIVPLSNGQHLVCLTNGFALLDLQSTTDSDNNPVHTKLKLIRISGRNDALHIYDNSPFDETVARYRSNHNTLHFQWSANYLVGRQIFYQYRLTGDDDTWSNWTTTTQITYPRLNPGHYTFEVRSVTPTGMLTNTTFHSFIIRKPWYQTPLAISWYIILLISFGLMIRFYISRRKWRAIGINLEKEQEKMMMEKTMQEQEIVKLTNEKLQAEVQHKTSQLASSTMSIMRKNELLNTIRGELLKQKQEMGDRLPRKYIQRITSIIDGGMDDEQDQEDFEKLYDQAHGNFFKRLKDDFPQLTPSDLRLCAYLRMNLSSKEIAPLLNISVRGVEERRYRLRKRMQLPPETNLSELIMTC